MKISEETWKERMGNLMARRAKGKVDSHHLDNPVGDYARHLRSVNLYGSLLDIGCGSQTIQKLLAESNPEIRCMGVDAFPIDDTIQYMKAEELAFTDKRFDTIICFATLDGCHDVEKAISEMKRVASRNVVFLTGIGIEPDQCHTHMITEEGLDQMMLPFIPLMKNWLAPKVLLVEYVYP